MFFKKTAWMAALLAVLAGVAYLLTVPRRTDQEKAAAGIFPAIPKESVDKIEINSSKHGKVKLAKAKEGWLAEQGGLSVPAEASVVEQLLDILAKGGEAVLVSRQASSHRKFQVDDASGVTVTAFNGGRKLNDFIAGGQGTDFFSNYIRLAGKNEVYMVNGYLKPLIDRPFKEFRDLTLMNVAAADVTAIEIGPPPKTLRLSKTGDKWTGADGREVKTESVDDLLSRLSGLRAFEAVEGAPDAAWFDKPAMSVAVTLKDGGRQGIVIGVAIADKNQRYIKVEGKTAIFKIGGWIMDDLVRLQGALAAGS